MERKHSLSNWNDGIMALKNPYPHLATEILLTSISCRNSGAFNTPLKREATPFLDF